MDNGEFIGFLQSGIMEVLLLASPLLFAALTVGLVVAILQATTSIQEQTLTFVPKIIAILLVLFLLGGWMFGQLSDYTIELFKKIPQMAR